MGPADDPGDDDLIARVRFMLQPEPWTEFAQCRVEGIPNTEFFPIRGQSQKVARACCARCPVAAECLDYADRSGTEWGIWGGEMRRRGPWQFIDRDYWDDLREALPEVKEIDLDDLE